jgi:hypothetical protein
MIKHNVTISANTKLKGFTHEDEDSWVKRKNYKGKTIQDIIDQINTEYGIVNIYASEFDDEYATYKSNVGGVIYIIDID